MPNRPVSQNQSPNPNPPTPTDPPERSWLARTTGRAGWLVLLGVAAMVTLVVVADLLESAGNWLVLAVVIVAVVAVVRRKEVEDIVQKRWRR